jgi:hypothetical protein
VRKHRDCRLGVAGVVKMLIRKMEKEESNHDGHCDSHEPINSQTSYCFVNISGRSTLATADQDISPVPEMEHRIVPESSMRVESTKLAVAGAEFHPE